MTRATIARGAFKTRLDDRIGELEALYSQLYDDPDAFDELINAMAAASSARPADLKRLDKAREADPEWYKCGDMFGMTMYSDLFAGDLKKLADRIPYLKEQKLTYLHLMPLLTPTTTVDTRSRTSTPSTRCSAPTRISRR